MMRIRAHAIFMLPIGTALVTVAGCATHETLGELPYQESVPFSLAGEAVYADEWWMAFNDVQLDGEIGAALERNLTLAETWERLQEANAIARRTRADQSPQVTGGARASGSGGRDTPRNSEVRLELAASYEVDLWGRIRNQVKADELRATAAEASYRAAAISLSAEVATAWYQMTTARIQLELLTSQLQINENVLEVLETRFGFGQTGSADVLRQRQLAEGTKAQIIDTETEIRLRETQLAVLAGRPPQERVEYPEASLPELPDMPETGLPSELIQRRPDVVEVQSELLATDKDLAAAVKDQYPSLSITASLSTAAENPAGLFNAWIGTIAGQLAAPLIDGGRRRTEAHRAEAVRGQALARYGQVVLDAFRDVEDALVQETNQSRTIESLEMQLVLAQETESQLRVQYLNGAAPFLDVLVAQLDQQQAERDLLTARRDLVLFRIALYRALAGGFETPREVREVAATETPDTSEYTND